MFAGGIFQAGNIIKVAMIQGFIDRLASLFDVGKIHNPAMFLSHRAGNVNRGVKRMSMKSLALMIVDHMGQTMGSFE